MKNSAHRVFVNSALHKQSPRNLLNTVKFNSGKNTNHNIGYSRNNYSKQCEIFTSRFVPETTPRNVVRFLKSKYDVNVQVKQMRTKYDAYTSFKITAPSYLKRDLLKRTNWISGTYVREFVGILNYFVIIVCLYCVFVSLLFNLKVISFNCHGIKSSCNTIQQLTHDHDIIMIQEHWLYPDELSYLSHLSEEFCSYSLSSMSIEDKLIRGRPYGGLV